ncbi:MAG: phosphotransferase [Chloroflexi bacterium]|nr:phosphotransferase [Chloroflexota bacterium]
MALPGRTGAYERAIDALTEELGTRFVLGERLGGGHLGARAVYADDGTSAVLKVSDASYRSAVEPAVVLAERLQAAGYPAPRPLHHGDIPGGYFFLQERAPGRPMRPVGVSQELDADELAVLLGLLDRHAGLGAGAPHDWTESVQDVSIHRRREWTLVAENPLPVVQRLLKACEQRLAGISDLSMRHDDLVIGDFGPHNILVDEEGQVTCVVDLESAGRGDRVIDTLNLLYMVEPHLLGVVRDAALAIARPEAFVVCGVYWIVRRLFLGIRSDDSSLEPVAQRMLAHIDLLT